MPLTPSHRPTAEEFARQLSRWGPHLAFNEADVLSDLSALAAAFPDADLYRRALDETLRQLQIVAARGPGRDMVGRLAGWRRHAFLSDRRTAGVRADLRIVYRVSNGRLELFGFGHRTIPEDVYARLRSRPLPR